MEGHAASRREPTGGERRDFPPAIVGVLSQPKLRRASRGVARHGAGRGDTEIPAHHEWRPPSRAICPHTGGNSINPTLRLDTTALTVLPGGRHRPVSDDVD